MFETNLSSPPFFSSKYISLYVVIIKIDNSFILCFYSATLHLILFQCAFKKISIVHFTFKGGNILKTALRTEICAPAKRASCTHVRYTHNKKMGRDRKRKRGKD